ncbi:MAG: DUF2254 domain-containing protein [Lapillicoccus sp.]
MRSRLVAIGEAFRSQLWPLPLIAVVLAVVGGEALPRMDAVVDGRVPSSWALLLFGGDAEAARTLLGAVSSSLITVTSLTFSLTVVTLQLASSQFSPRLLRTFTSDLFVQATLGLFLATFTFSLTVLRAVRTEGPNQAMVVPRISVNVSFVLALASVVGLIVFLAHLAQQIRVESMLREVHQSASSTIDVLFADLEEADHVSHSADALPVRPPQAQTVFAPSSGFLKAVPSAQLLRMAADLDVVVVIDRCTGDSVVEGTPVGFLWSTSAPLSSDAMQRVQDAVDRDVRTGFERSASGDVTYGLRQLTDVVNKALSPGINDPTTAVHALGHISAVLCDLADRGPGPLTFHDAEGKVRLVLNHPTLPEVVQAALTQPRRYGASDPQVMLRIVTVLDELAWHAGPGDHSMIREQLAQIRATIHAQDFDETSLRDLVDATQRVETTLSLHDGTQGSGGR